MCWTKATVPSQLLANLVTHCLCLCCRRMLLLHTLYHTRLQNQLVMADMLVRMTTSHESQRCTLHALYAHHDHASEVCAVRPGSCCCPICVAEPACNTLLACFQHTSFGAQLTAANSVALAHTHCPAAISVV